MAMAKKKRAICKRCKAKKYIKYLRPVPMGTKQGVGAWICRNPSKCDKRSPNYQK